MAGRKPGYIHSWDVRYKGVRHYKLMQNTLAPKNTITYESDVKSFQKLLTRNNRLKMVLNRYAYSVRNQLVELITPPTEDGAKDKRPRLRDSIMVRYAQYGGVFKDRPTYYVVDTSGRLKFAAASYKKKYGRSLIDEAIRRA